MHSSTVLNEGIIAQGGRDDGISTIKRTLVSKVTQVCCTLVSFNAYATQVCHRPEGRQLVARVSKVVEEVRLELESYKENTPEEFFNNPKSDRTKLFLSQIL